MPTRVFSWRLTSGGFLTAGCCFPNCFVEIFLGDKAEMEGDKS